VTRAGPVIRRNFSIPGGIPHRPACSSIPSAILVIVYPDASRRRDLALGKIAMPDW